jgi:hypothetical protein
MSLSDIKEIIILIKSTNIFSLHSNIYCQAFSERFTLIDMFATAATTRTPSLSPSPTRTGLPKAKRAPLELSTRFQRRATEPQNLKSGGERQPLTSSLPGPCRKISKSPRPE